MRFAFFSNFMNHHQLPFCQEMCRLLGEDNFRFVATSPVESERLALGYEDMNHAYPFVLCAYDGTVQAEEAARWALESDVVLFGAAPEKWILPRQKKHALTLYPWERKFRNPVWTLQDCRNAAGLLKRRNHYQNGYLCCASAYTASELYRLGLFRRRAYRWGYFPEVKTYANFEEMLSRKKPATLLWCARFMECKRPEAPVHLAQQLKREGYAFTLQLIGIGPMQAEIQAMAEQVGVTDCVRFLGAMSPQEVRRHMEESAIFLFTSDFGEGWGAVLNEAMNSGCAVVASHAIGSVPFLLEDGMNGDVYQNGNERDLLEKVKRLLDQPESARERGRRAYQTLVTQWNPAVAAQRITALSASLLQGTTHPKLFSSGICSEAPLLRNNWYKGVARDV